MQIVEVMCGSEREKKTFTSSTDQEVTVFRRDTRKNFCSFCFFLHKLTVEGGNMRCHNYPAAQETATKKHGPVWAQQNKGTSLRLRHWFQHHSPPHSPSQASLTATASESWDKSTVLCTEFPSEVRNTMQIYGPQSNIGWGQLLRLKEPAHAQSK